MWRASAGIAARCVCAQGPACSCASARWIISADVYVNGVHRAASSGRLHYFELDVTRSGRTGANLIDVRAEDYRRKTQTYGKQGYGEIQGIWQTVWLEDRPPGIH